MQIDRKSNEALQPVLHVLWALTMQLPVRVLKHMISPHMYCHVLLPQAFIQPLQFLAEVPTEINRNSSMSTMGKKGTLQSTKFKLKIILLTSS